MGMQLQLIKPSLHIKKEYLDFAREWQKNDEEIIPWAARLMGKDYKSWVEETQKNEKTPPPHLVPSSTFFLINTDGVIIGAINIRHYLNEALLRTGGHIGYGIRPFFRGNGFATHMLALALPITRNLGITKALLTCDKQNIASAKTIIKNGGILENEINEETRITQRYWISLDM
ncbi:MAG: GNAT family N-acetyltransferase [Aminobacterium sp.]|jgi:predicted acetyltransferase|uniref:GNAT family N-acetyltransferase n=1 Tax=Aminobacterium sp. TaxID=1872491 RepID=UPI001BCC5A07|nr:GNAT family N-acetyltransferase [Aminobacterium sp.]MDD2207289.1 GNAT family N-acetyltransferase [Aminobacterium sp.]MDD3427205.1 GNAT family N-acetyltransferase [Aminobacterium sp.]MDD3707418.1 GNAT family N-acetyltransferase [Aminobacterium sp.]MDD4229032.1 GNAT family N-acetyltransferase [Aminobacterium sp.]MDD4551675.1 GNAT family N-acetyltransferase [Aminobacterium sp.]